MVGPLTPATSRIIMPAATVLLVSDDEALQRTVQEVVGSVNRLRLRVVSALGEALELVGRPETALLLCHLSPENSAARTTDMLRELALRQRPVPTVVISEH